MIPGFTLEYGAFGVVCITMAVLVWDTIRRSYRQQNETNSFLVTVLTDLNDIRQMILSHDYTMSRLHTSEDADIVREQSEKYDRLKEVLEKRQHTLEELLSRFNK